MGLAKLRYSADSFVQTHVSRFAEKNYATFVTEGLHKDAVIKGVSFDADLDVITFLVEHEDYKDDEDLTIVWNLKTLGSRE